MRRLPLHQAQADLPAVAKQLRGDQVPVVLEEGERPVAVLISMDQYERYREYVRNEFFATMAEIRERNADKDPDEVYREVTEVVEEVRRERYERRRATEGSD